MDINKFYEIYKIDENFDEFLYQTRHPETKDFYQPYCIDNNIDDKHRLYFHYKLYGSVNFNHTRLNNKNKNNNRHKNRHKILIKIPTLRRPIQLINCIESFKNQCNNLDNIKIIISADNLDELTKSIKNQILQYNFIKLCFGNYKNKIDAYNSNLENTDFDVLVLASDDMVVVKNNYDIVISNYMNSYFPDTDGCLWFDTGEGNNITNTITIIGKKLFEKIKPIYNPRYLAYFCDDEFTQKCIKLGKIVRIEDCLIKHNISPHLQMHNDSTYLKSLKYSIIDKATYKIRKNVQFDIAGMSQLPDDHNLPPQVTEIKRNQNWTKTWHKSDSWYDDPISVLDLYILEKKYEKVFKMNEDEFLSFCKNYFRNFRWTIPKIIHQIWLGDKNEEIEKMMMSFKKYIKKYTDWRYILWDEQKLTDLNMLNKDIYDEEKFYDCKSDIARLEILHQFGGVYIDSDVIWLENKSLETLFSYVDRGLLLFKEKSGDKIGSGYLTKETTRCANTIIGSTIMNPIVSFLIGKLRKSYFENRRHGVVASTGPDFIQKYVDVLNLKVNSHEYVFPIWFCMDESRNPEYNDFIKYKSSRISKIVKNYPNSILFHKGWAK
jgi:hypothetical protein